MTIREYAEENYGEELRAEGMDRANKLFLCLIEADRQEDMIRAMHDSEFRKRLFEEFDI